MKKSRGDICCLVVCLIAFIINEVFIKPSRHSITFMSNHFNDLLAMPAMLAYINIVLRCFRKPTVVHLKFMLVIAIGCGFIWEIAAIWIKPSSVCDKLDFACYMVGTFMYRALILLRERNK